MLRRHLELKALGLAHHVLEDVLAQDLFGAELEAEVLVLGEHQRPKELQAAAREVEVHDRVLAVQPRQRALGRSMHDGSGFRAEAKPCKYRSMSEYLLAVQTCRNQGRPNGAAPFIHEGFNNGTLGEECSPAARPRQATASR